MTKDADPGIRTLDRSLSLLSFVVNAETPQTLAEVAAQSGLPLSTVARLLKGLEAANFIDRDSSGRYITGLAFLRLAAVAINSSPWLRIAERHLRGLASSTGESAYMAVLDETGENAVYVLRAPSPNPIRHWTSSGRPEPVDGTAMGAALLSNAGPEGYVAVEGAVTPDVTAIAAPLYGSDGSVRAAIAVIGPSYRIAPERVTVLGAAVKELADLLSKDVDRLVHQGV
ncbi:IclR family transcriptional regulator [Planotetraspora sp. A-T 1434]|uniref:IclR family transcriptional regulator n=1 Tax=Planotetraspora sp. A-T 1434 TaxID=2979219 RepID=UPI0021C1F86D|nr:IclR family transcriptional regulator [Planotetraspora sp. A-T 1434]MCT9934179.1 IclR family transcriptional regulator [Planotetraspora sp. A-T 1434]